MHVRLVRLLILLVCQYDSFDEVKTRIIRAVSNKDNLSQFYSLNYEKVDLYINLKN